MSGGKWLDWTQGITDQSEQFQRLKKHLNKWQHYCWSLANKVIQRSRHGFIQNRFTSQYNFFFLFFPREIGLMNKGAAIKALNSIHLGLTKAFDPGLHSNIHITKAEKYELGKNATKRLLRWLRQCAQRAFIQSSLSDSEGASSETLQQVSCHFWSFFDQYIH